LARAGEEAGVGGGQGGGGGAAKTLGGGPGGGGGGGGGGRVGRGAGEGKNLAKSCQQARVPLWGRAGPGGGGLVGVGGGGFLFCATTAAGAGRASWADSPNPKPNLFVTGPGPGGGTGKGGGRGGGGGVSMDCTGETGSTSSKKSGLSFPGGGRWGRGGGRGGATTTKTFLTHPLFRRNHGGDWGNPPRPAKGRKLRGAAGRFQAGKGRGGDKPKRGVPGGGGRWPRDGGKEGFFKPPTGFSNWGGAGGGAGERGPGGGWAGMVGGPAWGGGPGSLFFPGLSFGGGARLIGNRGKKQKGGGRKTTGPEQLVPNAQERGGGGQGAELRAN